MDFFDRLESTRTGGAEQAVLVHLDLPDGAGEDERQEFHHLVLSTGVTPVAEITGQRKRPDPALFIGRGKADEVAEAVRDTGARVVLFNHELSPAQERSLEQVLCCRVLDRTGLILDIFAQRARTREGRLQVELAQLQHLATRLVRGWTHLERQRGGIGLRGPGETQLETDRRLIRARIDKVQGRLNKVKKQRAQGRRARQRSETPLISLVGYTNAGKSTLFNRLTRAEVHVADQLFATLDPTLRRVRIPGLGPAILADTVGFIRQLPHQLVDAFSATLEETRDADLLVHIADASSPERADNIAAVEAVLAEIGADAVPVLHVFNKADLAGKEPHIDRDEQGYPLCVWMSALDGQGMELLHAAVAERMASSWVNRWIQLPPDAGRLRSRLHDAGEVLNEDYGHDGSMLLHVRINAAHFYNLLREQGLNEDEITLASAPVAGDTTPSYNPTSSHNAG